MRKLIVLLLLIGLLWFIYGDTYNETGFRGVFEEIRDDVQEIREHPWVQSGLETFRQGIQHFTDWVSEATKTEEPDEQIHDIPDLTAPDEQIFSILHIEIGDHRQEVEAHLGNPQRASQNEYGTNWFSYHDNYHNFIMVSYDSEGKVNGLYTNQDLLSSTNGITFASSRDEVREIMPKPLKVIRKGFINYQIQTNDEYDIFEIDDCFVTIFYDLHQGAELSAVLLIEKSLEDRKSDFFAKPSETLREGFEYQLFDLTNATRVKFGLPVLSWHEAARNTVRAHSADMAENHYFDHTNLRGESPFDRLTKDAISFQAAGENLATGQPSSIFAHEGLMNSLGHRENKLKNYYQSFVAGVAFDQDDQPYYTENYLGN